MRKCLCYKDLRGFIYVFLPPYLMEWDRKAFFNRWKNDAKFIARYFSIKIEEESPDERLSPVAKDCPTGKPERVWRLFLHAIYVFHKRK